MSGEKKTKKSGAAKVVPSVRIKDFAVILAPVVTEKSAMAAGNGAVGLGKRYVFKVDPRATKVDIRAAIENVFKVKVAKVNTLNYMGKVKRTGGSVGRRASFKKAYVTLHDGHSISVVEGV